MRTAISMAAALAATGWAVLASGGAAKAQTLVPWGCDAPTGRVCYFSIQFAGGGSRNFSLTAGRRIDVSGTTPGRDIYIVSIDAPNLGDVHRCRQLITMGRQCQVKTVDPNYND